MSKKLSLVLEEIDPETFCISREWQLGEVDIDTLSKLLGDDYSEIDCAYYDLDQNEVRLISSTYLNETLDFVQGGLTRRHFLCDLPYKIHTNRELAMMLRGEKPFSRFAMGSGEEFGTYIRQPFSKYVEAGVLRAFVEHEDTPRGRSTIYSFTLPGEEWRVAAMKEVWETASRTGWNDDLTRREGRLYGYEDWQNDAYLKLMREVLERARDK